MKVEAPERIWIESEGECPYFYHEEELSDVAPHHRIRPRRQAGRTSRRDRGAAGGGGRAAKSYEKPAVAKKVAIASDDGNGMVNFDFDGVAWKLTEMSEGVRR